MSQPPERPPAPLPPPPPPPPPARPSGAQLLKAALERGGPGAEEDLRELLRRRRASFSQHLKWLIVNHPVPSLIQEGPQCGLVALWMAGALLHPSKAVSLDEVVQVALERGYTAQGEMFSVPGQTLTPSPDTMRIPTMSPASDVAIRRIGLSSQMESERSDRWKGMDRATPWDQQGSSAGPEGGLPTASLPGRPGAAGALPCRPSLCPTAPGGCGGDVLALQAGQELPLPAVELPAAAGEQRPAD